MTRHLLLCLAALGGAAGCFDSNTDCKDTRTCEPDPLSDDMSEDSAGESSPKADAQAGRDDVGTAPAPVVEVDGGDRADAGLDGSTGVAPP
jgi:hypothetical protein